MSIVQSRFFPNAPSAFSQKAVFLNLKAPYHLFSGAYYQIVDDVI